MARIYLAPDANCLLAITDACLRSRDRINVIIAGKQPEWQWLDRDAAVRHCAAGIGVWPWAGRGGDDPDVVMACAGDAPTLETLAAVTLLREQVPDLRVRVVNVVDLRALAPPEPHAEGLDAPAFDALFPPDRPVIFAFHGYPGLVRQLVSQRPGAARFQVRGYQEQGSTTTPFDMVVLNHLDRFQLALDAIRQVPRLSDQIAAATARYWAAMERHRLYIGAHGEDLPEVRDWIWSAEPGVPATQPV